MMNKKEFFQAVNKEVKLLKENLTDEEKNRLSFTNLNPNSATQCVYGQATGNCSSERARQLISKCCLFLLPNRIFTIGLMDSKDYFSFAGDCKTDIRDIYYREEGRIAYVSPLETYIAHNSANNMNVIKYIKGETKKLVL